MLEISLLPCQMSLTKLGFADDEISPDCKASASGVDMKESFKDFNNFLESPNFVIYTN